MKLSEEDFEMMLNAAWSAFENTLFVWGLSTVEIEDFFNRLEEEGTDGLVEDALVVTCAEMEDE